MELYGTKGSIVVPDPNMFGGSVYVSLKEGGKWKEYKTNKMPLGKINIRSASGRSNETPTNANYRGVGLSEMLYCIERKKKHRCNGELSLHVLDGKPQKIKTTCEKPKKFPLNELKKILL